jgi:hypothetical protein
MEKNDFLIVVNVINCLALCLEAVSPQISSQISRSNLSFSFSFPAQEFSSTTRDGFLIRKSEAKIASLSPILRENISKKIAKRTFLKRQREKNVL